MNRQEILQRAAELTSYNRNRDYGEPEQNFVRIALLWEVYLNMRPGDHQSGDPVTQILGHDVAILMVLMKVARLMETPQNTDSWVDLAGYAACGGELSISRVNEREPEDPIEHLGRIFNDIEAEMQQEELEEENYWQEVREEAERIRRESPDDRNTFEQGVADAFGRIY